VNAITYPTTGGLGSRAAVGLACVLLVGGFWLSTADAQTLGRLFTTPEERAELDEIRNNPDIEEPTAPQMVVAPEQGPTGPTVEHVTINGIVLRSSGQNYSWINGDNIRGGDATREGIRVETRRLTSGGTVRLVLPSGLDTVQLKPGQKIDVLTGSILEPYEQRSDERAVNVFEEDEQPETYLNEVAPSDEDDIVEYGVYGTY